MNQNREAGKGSRYRPVNKEKFDSNWDKIFCKHKDYIWIEDGDLGSGWFCLNCNKKKNEIKD